MSNWNPLYPSDEGVDTLEEAAREAEWEDDLKRMKKHHYGSFDIPDDEEDDY